MIFISINILIRMIVLEFRIHVLILLFKFYSNAQIFPSNITATKLQDMFKQSFGENKINLAYSSKESLFGSINRQADRLIISRDLNHIQTINAFNENEENLHKLSSMFCFIFRFGTNGAQSLEVLHIINIVYLTLCLIIYRASLD